MTSITWAGPRCVQELGTFLEPENRTQRRCVVYFILHSAALLATPPLVMITVKSRDQVRRPLLSLLLILTIFLSAKYFWGSNAKTEELPGNTFNNVMVVLPSTPAHPLEARHPAPQFWRSCTSTPTSTGPRAGCSPTAPTLSPSTPSTVEISLSNMCLRRRQLFTTLPAIQACYWLTG